MQSQSLLTRWDAKRSIDPLRLRAELVDQGVVLGARTILARSLDTPRPLSERNRLVALLAVAYDGKVRREALDHLEAAAQWWRSGEKVLAHIRLAFARLPPLESEADAYRLFLADCALAGGIRADALLKELGFPAETLALLKFDPEQPRVPAGQAGGGEWTNAGGASRVPVRVTVEDEPPVTEGRSVAHARDSAPSSPGASPTHAQTIVVAMVPDDEEGGEPGTIIDRKGKHLLDPIKPATIDHAIESGIPAAGESAGAEASGNVFPTTRAQLMHIFRNSEGHILDTPENRQLLLDVANDPRYVLGPDRHGNLWSGKILPDGRQVWTQTRTGRIISGGINKEPMTYNPETGLSARTKPRNLRRLLMTKALLDADQAYAAMYYFLDEIYQRTKGDDLCTLVSGMSLLQDGSTADAAVESEWNDAIDHVTSGDRTRLLNANEAYAAMCHFLGQCYLEEIAALTQALTPQPDGTIPDPAVARAWQEAFDYAADGGEAGQLIITPVSKI